MRNFLWDVRRGTYNFVKFIMGYLGKGPKMREGLNQGGLGREKDGKTKRRGHKAALAM